MHTTSSLRPVLGVGAVFTSDAQCTRRHRALFGTWHVNGQHVEETYECDTCQAECRN
jgi:hypothetical protein